MEKEKFECGDCGCFFWVEDRNDFECPNCKMEDDTDYDEVLSKVARGEFKK